VSEGEKAIDGCSETSVEGAFEGKEKEAGGCAGYRRCIMSSFALLATHRVT